MPARNERVGLSVMLKLLTYFYIKESRGKEMIAMLWAQQIMLGKKEYKDVPRLLKEKVKEILIDSGFEELVTDNSEK